MVAFLSYSHKDGERTQRIVEIARNLGIRVLRDEDDLAPGDSITEWMSDSLSTADTFICLLSPAYRKSKACTREFFAAVAVACSGRRHLQIVPVLVEDCDVPPIIADLRYIDASRDIDSKSIRQQFSDALAQSSSSPSFHLEENLRRLLLDQMGRKENKGGWGLSNPIFFGLTNPTRKVNDAFPASVTQTFWSIEALRSLRISNEARLSPLHAELHAKKFLAKKVERWQRRDYNRDELSHGRHLATSLLSLQRSPLIEAEKTSHERLEKKLAAYALLGRLVSAFKAITTERLNASPTNLAASGYMVWALSEAANQLDRDSDAAQPDDGGQCWNLADTRLLARHTIGDYASRILNCAAWDDCAGLDSCLNPNLQKLLTLLMLGRSTRAWPKEWDTDMNEVRELLASKLRSAIEQTQRERTTSLAKLHPDGPADLTTTYALGLCVDEYFRAGFIDTDETPRRVLDTAEVQLFDPRLQALSGSLTWSLAILLEQAVNPAIHAGAHLLARNIEKDIRARYRYSSVNEIQIHPSLPSTKCPSTPVITPAHLDHWRRVDLLSQIEGLSLIDSTLESWCATSGPILTRNLMKFRLPDATLRRAVVLTGPSCSGKSTIAARLAHLNWYFCARRWQTHQSQGNDRIEATEKDAGSRVVTEEEFVIASEKHKFLFEYCENDIKYGYPTCYLDRPENRHRTAVFSIGTNSEHTREFVQKLRDSGFLTIIIALDIDLQQLRTRLEKRYTALEDRERNLKAAMWYYAEALPGEAQRLATPVFRVNTGAGQPESILQFLDVVSRSHADASLLES